MHLDWYTNTKYSYVLVFEQTYQIAVECVPYATPIASTAYNPAYGPVSNSVGSIRSRSTIQRFCIQRAVFYQ